LTSILVPSLLSSLPQASKNQAAQNPTNTVYDAKRLIGRKFEDPTVQRDLKLVSYKVRKEGGKEGGKEGRREGLRDGELSHYDLVSSAHHQTT